MLEEDKSNGCNMNGFFFGSKMHLPFRMADGLGKNGSNFEILKQKKMDEQMDHI
ncbi:hypothetical protein DERF_007268 [Dermatophagoides farinae]|uniref:Uncharacterized protein n=1 Tax=Dermatophagoides farinae TaxID=6954 RepID=A0A922I0Z1_DERFA|nr:hypothetical protein DERF_007268 [Dermatophagoides farinae]